MKMEIVYFLLHYVLELKKSHIFYIKINFADYKEKIKKERK